MARSFVERIACSFAFGLGGAGVNIIATAKEDIECACSVQVPGGAKSRDQLAPGGPRLGRGAHTRRHSILTKNPCGQLALIASAGSRER